MSQPKPVSSLDNSCAAIHDNTLYVYTPDAFQSIKLEEGAKWEKLPMGESVTGATCVGSSPDNADAAGFWVVGGAGGSTGLQKYSYSSGDWSSPSPIDQITKDRQFHSSVYIKANDQILVFAGTTDGTAAPTMETYTIGASEPHDVQGFQSAAPNSIRPILLTWTAADAVMVGGDAANTRVYLFNPTAGWRDFGTNLAEPIAKDTTQIQGALIKGKDGSQNLYLFDMSETPNVVRRYVIQDANGNPVSNSPAITERSLETRQTQDNWPAYDSELAPTVSRQNFAIAQNDDGMVVFAGGNDQEPLSMFDAYENSWLNTTNFLTEDTSTVQSIISSSTILASSSSSTSTSTLSATSTIISSTTAESTTVESTTIQTTAAETTAAETTEAVAGAGTAEDDKEGGGLSSNTILGITLGSIFAFLLVLALALFLLRRRKTKRARAAAAAKAANDGGMPGDEKNPRAFGNGPPGPLPRGHRPQGSADSYSSMAILMGRVNQQQKPGISRKGSNDSRASIISHHRQFKSTISKPIPQQTSNPILQGQDDRGVTFQPTVAEPRPRDGAAPDPQDGTRRSSGWNRYWSGGSALQILGFGGAKRNTVTSEQSSRYSQASNRNPRVTQDSATVPPLNFEGHTAMNRVNSGSPVVTGHVGKLPFGEGMAGKIERPSSRASSGYSSGIPESVNEAWDPTDHHKDKPWGHNRAPSSVYNSGFNFGTALAPSGSPDRAPPTGVSSQPQLAMASKSSDMSWLNLGEQRNNQSRF